MISREVTQLDQGRMQGALSAYSTLANVIGPQIYAALFTYYISDSAPFQWVCVHFVWLMVALCRVDTF